MDIHILVKKRFDDLVEEAQAAGKTLNVQDLSRATGGKLSPQNIYTFFLPPDDPRRTDMRASKLAILLDAPGMDITPRKQVRFKNLFDK
jgi:hypothetical protein